MRVSDEQAHHCVEMLEGSQKIKICTTGKIMTQLTTVAEYVKHCAHYLANNHTKKPCTNTSLAIAWWMGKDEYFAQKIHENKSSCFIMVIFHHQKYTRREASGLCSVTQTLFKRFVYTLLHKSLVPSPLTFFVNTSTMSFF